MLSYNEPSLKMGKSSKNSVAPLTFNDGLDVKSSKGMTFG